MGKVIDLRSRSKRTTEPEFADRLQRIRASLDKINRLMHDLKEMQYDPATLAD